MKQLNTVTEFVAKVKTLPDVGDAYEVFEFECTPALRGAIYEKSSEGSPEPFRSAMHNLGFTSY